jgi:hypothetical protein
LCAILATPAAAQDPNSSSSPRFFFDTDIGTRTDLGFLPPASDFGASFELPAWQRVEFQGMVSYSPDRKRITHDGHSIDASGTGIVWINSRVGASADFEGYRLQTSQFLKAGWRPSAGIAIRTNFLTPGRFYADYWIGTGCVWATPSSPCKVQSNRISGPTITQEWQMWPHVRIGLNSGIYNFCDQTNPNVPIPRTCQWGGTALVFMRLQLGPSGSVAMY